MSSKLMSKSEFLTFDKINPGISHTTFYKNGNIESEYLFSDKSRIIHQIGYYDTNIDSISYGNSLYNLIFFISYNYWWR